MDEIKKLKARLVELNDIAKGIQAKADGERRDLRAEEQTELDTVMSEFDVVESDIKRRERIIAQAARLDEPQGRQVPAAAISNAAPEPHAAPRGLPNTILPTVRDRARWGFQNMGEFAFAVRTAAVAPSNMDQRLIQNAAASTYGAEGTGADGGFAVPPEWRAEILKMVDAEGSLLGMTDQQTVTGNTITFPMDETTAHQSTGGVLAYWDSEAAAMTQSKPSLKELSIKLNRLTALVPVTDELLEDSAAMSSYITGKAGEKIAFKINDAIINGTGVGQPLGIMNAPSRVSVAKITSQVGNTIHGRNIAAMIARLPAGSFSRAVWLANQDTLPQIMALGFDVTNGTTTVAGAGALWMTPGQLQGGSPYGNILGRPVIITEACAALGTVGDIILADMSKYLSVVKGAMKSDVSIHLWFDQGITAFRFVVRMNGQPWLSAAIARKNGSNTLSHFVSLDTRAP